MGHSSAASGRSRWGGGGTSAHRCRAAVYRCNATPLLLCLSCRRCWFVYPRTWDSGTRDSSYLLSISLNIFRAFLGGTHRLQVDTTAAPVSTAMRATTGSGSARMANRPKAHLRRTLILDLHTSLGSRLRCRPLASPTCRALQDTAPLCRSCQSLAVSSASRTHLLSRRSCACSTSPKTEQPRW